MDWQPIDTAPRDGREVILTDGRKVWTASWWTQWDGRQLPVPKPYHGVSEPGWMRTNLDEEYGRLERHATHWQPLPEPPNA